MYKPFNIVSRDSLFLFLIHVISEEFKDHAILKGGMVLRLFGSTRETLDLDYTFIPYSSKKEILPNIKAMLNKIEGLDSFDIKVNSKMIRVIVSISGFSAHIEVSVAESIKTDIISTGSLRSEVNAATSKVVKIMSLDTALSHKLAAWNERRLIRDLYDVFYLYAVQTTLPELSVLEARLKNISSRIPKLKKIKSMNITELKLELKNSVDALSQDMLEESLVELLAENELTGLSMRMKDGLNRLINIL